MTKKTSTSLFAGLIIAIAAIMAVLWPTTQATAAKASIGDLAPDFTVQTTSGEEITLSQFKDKIVVLEWTNHQCPFVRKHYDSNNMQDLQKELTDKGVVWISIVSSAPGKQGNVDITTANDIIQTEGAHPSYKILDPKGTLGKLYGAKTTPHMFVIDGASTLAYAGAIDDDGSPYPDRAKGANNYVRNAVTNLLAGEKVATAQTFPYGCSVKY